MMNKRYITILDFGIGKVFQYEVDKLDIKMDVDDKNTFYEDFLREKGHSIGSIEWMEHGPSHISGPHIEKEYYG